MNLENKYLASMVMYVRALSRRRKNFFLFLRAIEPFTSCLIHQKKNITTSHDVVPLSSSYTQKKRSLYLKPQTFSQSRNAFLKIRRSLPSPQKWEKTPTVGISLVRSVCLKTESRNRPYISLTPQKPKKYISLQKYIL